MVKESALGEDDRGDEFLSSFPGEQGRKRATSSCF